MAVQSSKDIVTRWYATRDPALLAEDIEWHVLPRFPAGGVYQGRADVLERFFPAMTSTFERFSAVPERYVADGETVVVLGEYRGVMAGREIAAPFAHVWKVRDRRLARFHQITDTAAFDAKPERDSR